MLQDLNREYQEKVRKLTETYTTTLKELCFKAEPEVKKVLEEQLFQVEREITASRLVKSDSNLKKLLTLPDGFTSGIVPSWSAVFKRNSLTYCSIQITYTEKALYRGFYAGNDIWELVKEGKRGEIVFTLMFQFEDFQTKEYVHDTHTFPVTEEGSQQLQSKIWSLPMFK